MKRFFVALFAIGAMGAPGPSGAPPALHAQTVGDDVDIAQVLFAPELIMQHRRAINLNDEQRDAISRLIQEVQGKVTALQWELLDDTQGLADILRQPRVDLDRALDQLDTVLEREKRVKQAHLEMLIRIKNVLRTDQIETLERLRAEGAGREIG